MEKGNISLQPKKVIYLCMITSLTVFSLFLVGLDLLLEWEIWMLPVIIAGTAICWILYIMDKVPRRTQIYICGVVAMFFVFYYCIKITTSYDCGTVIVFMIFLLSFTREKPLLWMGIGSSVLSLVFHLMMVRSGTGLNFSLSSVVRTAMVFLVIPLSALIIERVVRAWDVVEKKYLERIEVLTEENERANNFLANVSHEIRTPISAVLGLSYVMENEDLSPEDTEKALGSIPV